MASEFELIRQHFTRDGRHTDLGVGDDAALFTPTAGMQLVVSTDMLVEGTHFLPDTDPRDLGWKIFAVNVSDIAAMGATPRWSLLALAMPAPDESWVEGFARGLFECAQAFDIDLVGGDTTRGPRTLCVTIFGEVPAGHAITRGGAAPGDEVWVTNTPGRAALRLAHLQGRLRLTDAGAAECVAALQRPQPRVAAGRALRDVASAMLDVSDGIAGDLGHILERSGVGAEIQVAALPLDALIAFGADDAAARAACLSGGDDYELLFTAPAAQRAAIERIATTQDLAITRIGRIDDTPGLRVVDADGNVGTAGGYDHFS